MIKIVRKLGLPLKDESGRLAITPHWPRVGGSRHMVRNAVSAPSVMGLARWDSACVLRYLKSATMANITNEYRAGAKMLKATAEPGKSTALTRFSESALKQLAALEADEKKSEEDFDKLVRELKVVSSHASPAYILSSKSKFHVTFPWQDRLPKLGITKCSWRYGNSPIDRLSMVPENTPNKNLRFTCFEVDDPDDTDDSAQE